MLSACARTMAGKPNAALNSLQSPMPWLFESRHDARVRQFEPVQRLFFFMVSSCSHRLMDDGAYLCCRWPFREYFVRSIVRFN